MAVHDPELLEWNVQATAFLSLSPCDQELYIAAVNAGADPELLLDAFFQDGWLDALTTSGIDPLGLLFALPAEAADMVVEAAIGTCGF
jgi:hypothetical protein